MRKNTVAPKKTSATDAKLRASTSPTTNPFGEDAILSPIKEETTEEDFSRLPEVQGSSDTATLTTDNMEPLSDQQKDFFNSYLDDARNRMEEERREERKFYEETISRMKEQMEEMREDYNDLRRSRSSPVAEITNPKHAFETPKVQRPQDKAYQEILTASKRQLEHEETTTHSFRPQQDNNHTQQNEMMKIYDIRMNNLMTSMGSILKYSKKEDTTELPKFQGGDSQWPKWYQLLRAYLQARGWLPTFDHPIGPSTNDRPTHDFDTDINSLIYQKL
jgi:hypothetical protein